MPSSQRLLFTVNVKKKMTQPAISYSSTRCRFDSNIQQYGWSQHAAEFRYIWTIHGCYRFYTDTDEEDLPRLNIESPIITDDIKHNKWQLNIEQEKEKSRKLSLLSLPSSPDDQQRHLKVCVNVHLLDNKGSLFMKKEDFQSGKVLGAKAVDVKCSGIYYAFTYELPSMGHYLETLLYDGSLRLLFRLWYHDVTGSAPGVRNAIAQFNETHENLCLLLPNIEQMLKDGTFSDVKIITSSEEPPILAHKVLLAARSDVFHKMLTVPMSESGTNSICISEFPHQIVKGMLQYIYTNQTEIEKDDAEYFVKIADMYNLKGLKLEAEVLLGNNLTVENVVDVFAFAVLYHCNRLKKKASDFIVRNSISLKKNRALTELAKTNLQDVLDLHTATLLLD